MELNINGESYEVASLGGLRYHLPKISDTHFCEVWLYSDSGWPAVCALVNSSSAWLMFLRHEGDSGYSTRNPNYAGPKEAVTEYFLSNGQRDEYQPNGISPRLKRSALSSISSKIDQWHPGFSGRKNTHSHQLCGIVLLNRQFPASLQNLRCVFASSLSIACSGWRPAVPSPWRLAISFLFEPHIAHTAGIRLESRDIAVLEHESEQHPGSAKFVGDGRLKLLRFVPADGHRQSSIPHANLVRCQKLVAVVIAGVFCKLDGVRFNRIDALQNALRFVSCRQLHSHTTVRQFKARFFILRTGEHSRPAGRPHKIVSDSKPAFPWLDRQIRSLFRIAV